MNRFLAVIMLVIVGLLAPSVPAGAGEVDNAVFEAMEPSVAGTKTGHKWRSSCSVVAPQPWVQGHTRGTTYIKGPGSSQTVTFYNPELRFRWVVGLYNGGKWSVSIPTEIRTVQTIGYCGD